MTTPLYPYQIPPQSQQVLGAGGAMMSNPFYYLLTALFNRTGGPSGIPFTSGQGLAASGSGQGDALLLMDDFNEVLSGTGGVVLDDLQPAQSQVVYNGSGSTITVYPTAGGQIDSNAVNAGVTLANGTFGFFTAYEVLASGAPLYRSWQAQSGATGVPVNVIPTLNWYVAATGNDSNDGQSAATAFATIQHAINVILSYWFGGQVVTLNVGAGSFAAFTMTGLGQGSSGSSSLDELGIVLIGAGSGSTTIAAGSQLRGGRLNLSACTVDCTAAASAFSGDAYSTLVLNGDVIFSGNSSSAIALDFNQFSSIIQDSNVTLSGTIGTYFSGFSFANYEQNGGALTVAGGATVDTLLVLDLLSNYHFFGGSVVVSGTTVDNVYVASAGSVVACYGAVALDTVWTGGGGLAGVLETGSRSEGAASAPTVTSSGGSVALTAGSNANSAVATLTVTGGSPATGTVTITVHEFLCYSLGVASTYAVGLQDGTGSWAAGATAIISSVVSTSGGRAYQMTWSNNGTGLANATYIFNLIGQT